MRNILFIILICFLASCSGTRKLTSSSSTSTKLEQKSETHENATLTDKSATKRDSVGSLVKSQVDSIYSDFVAKVTEYDSDKPNDPVTGKPPIIRETELVYHRASSHRTQSDHQSHVSNNKQNDVKAASSKSGKSAVKASGKEVRKTVEEKDTAFPWWIVILTITVLGSIIYAAVRWSWWGKCIRLFQKILK